MPSLNPIRLRPAPRRGRAGSSVLYPSRIHRSAELAAGAAQHLAQGVDGGVARVGLDRQRQVAVAALRARRAGRWRSAASRRARPGGGRPGRSGRRTATPRRRAMIDVLVGPGSGPRMPVSSGGKPPGAALVGLAAHHQLDLVLTVLEQLDQLGPVVDVDVAARPRMPAGAGGGDDAGLVGSAERRTQPRPAPPARSVAPPAVTADAVGARTPAPGRPTAAATATPPRQERPALRRARVTPGRAYRSAGTGTRPARPRSAASSSFCSWVTSA